MWNSLPVGICCQNKDLLDILPFLSSNSRKTGNMRTAAEIVNPCIEKRLFLFLFLWIYGEHPQKPASLLPLIKLLFPTKYKFSTIFLSRFPLADTNDSHDSREREETLFIDLQTFGHLVATFPFEMTTWYF